MLDVGRIAHSHGLRGEVVVVLTSNRLERVAAGSVLHAGDRRLAVVSSRPHKNGHIVAFNGVSGRDDADRLKGLVLRAEPLSDPDELWVHELIGALVVDQYGIERGKVIRVLENPASDILELDSGSLVPAGFVKSLVPNERVMVDVPDGLFDLDAK